jgi:TRAP-type mannitol/chloroaromatic compound transport system permease small subunit
MVRELSCLLGRIGRCATFARPRQQEASRGEGILAIAFADRLGLLWLRAAGAKCDARWKISAHRSDDAAAENKMRPLLAISTAIDLFNEKIGYVCNSLVLLACLVSAANAMIRYAFSYSSNGWLELQWYMFAIMVMFGSSYTFKRNEHVRVEILYLLLSERAQLWLDLLGTLLFLIPACLLLAYLSWPFFMQAYAVGEMSGNAGGLIRWPIKFVIPAGFVLLALQGVSEVVKRAAALQGYVTIDAKYERPLQ